MVAERAWVLITGVPAVIGRGRRFGPTGGEEEEMLAAAPEERIVFKNAWSDSDVKEGVA